MTSAKTHNTKARPELLARAYEIILSWPEPEDGDDNGQKKAQGDEAQPGERGHE